MEIVLTTRRLVLRRAMAEDAPFILGLMNEPAYHEHIGDRGVRTVADAARYIADKYTASYERNGYGLYVAELHADGTPVGVCGLVKRDVLDHPDIGFAISQRHWSNGYASEAAVGTVEFARDRLGLSYLYGVASPKNARSIQLLLRLGLSYLRPLQLPGYTSPSDLYGTALQLR